MLDRTSIVARADKDGDLVVISLDAETGVVAVQRCAERNPRIGSARVYENVLEQSGLENLEICDGVQRHSATETQPFLAGHVLCPPNKVQHGVFALFLYFESRARLIFECG